MTIRVRPATGDDARAVWEWRNDPTTRASSSTTAEVPWSDHEAWFVAALANPESWLLIAELDGRRVGVVRFDAQGSHGHWVVSINLAPEARGQGLGAPTLDAGWRWLASSQDVIDVVAHIRSTNRASLRTFEAAGYGHASRTDGWLHLVRYALP